MGTIRIALILKSLFVVLHKISHSKAASSLLAVSSCLQILI